MKLSLVAEESDLYSIRCEGQITQYEFRTGYEPISELLGPEAYSKRVLLSLAGSPYIDSSGISWLIQAHNRFKTHNGRLVIYDLQPFVKNVMDSMSMPQVLYLAADEKSARELVKL